jgi:hypothetical protein
MSDLKRDIEFYTTNKEAIECEHTGKWVLISDQKVIGIHNSFENAADEAVRLFGEGPYLIRQVGAPPIVLPASVMYHKVRHA